MTTGVRLAVGLGSMAGFTASGVALVVGSIGEVTALSAMALSLGAYVSALAQMRGGALKSGARSRAQPGSARTMLWTKEGT